VPLSAIDSITPAFEHTKQQLFRPFRIGQWWRLATVGFLAGELSSGGGYRSFLNSFQNGAHTRGIGGLGFPEVHPLAFVGLIATIAVCGFVLAIVFMYISSVMRFVLFDSVLTRECHIRAGWAKRQGEGWKLFVFKLLYALVSLLVMSLIIGIPLLIGVGAGWWRDPKEHIGGWFLVGLPALLLIVGVALLSALIYVLTKDFVVPQLAFEDIGVMDAWRRLWGMIQGEMGAYAGYIGMKILLAIAAGIVIGIASVFVVLVMVIPVVGAVIAAKTTGMSWTSGTITMAIVGGAALFALLMFVISLISVPAIVFFPAYGMYFLASRYQKLASAVWPAPSAAPATPPGISQPPMGLPPGPEPIG
jgi:hypothetical protein